MYSSSPQRNARRTHLLVIPEMKQIGFSAESVRVPTSTGSLIILVVNFQDDASGEGIRRDLINGLYKKAAQADPNGYLIYSDQQNVSADIVGHPTAAAAIEGHEPHTRTARININLASASGGAQPSLNQGEDSILQIQVTQAVIYGWYDNELASYVNMMAERTTSIADDL